MGTDAADAAPGDMVVLEIDGAELCGVAASDGGVIYRNGDGRIVMGYPDSMDVSSVQLYRLEVQ